ncbi:MAG: hypothetical protein K2J74_06170 [Muribaculaceae bacterium]|nr:hypothetical protein [Muribaculaceae bacterium]
MKNKYLASVCVFWVLMAIVGCTGSHDTPVPRPRGYFRIQLPDTGVQNVLTPWSMLLPVSTHTRISYPHDSVATDARSQWLNIDYPMLNATVYCTYHTNPQRTKLLDAISNRYERIALNARSGKMPQVILLQDTILGITHQVFFSERNNVVPFQFLSTDSATFLFSGAAYFHGNMNPDSIAPAIDIVEADLLNMLQNLKLHGNSN